MFAPIRGKGLPRGFTIIHNSDRLIERVWDLSNSRRRAEHND